MCKMRRLNETAITLIVNIVRVYFVAFAPFGATHRHINRLPMFSVRFFPKYKNVFTLSFSLSLSQLPVLMMVMLLLVRLWLYHIWMGLASFCTTRKSSKVRYGYFNRQSTGWRDLKRLFTSTFSLVLLEAKNILFWSLTTFIYIEICLSPVADFRHVKVKSNVSVAIVYPTQFYCSFFFKVFLCFVEFIFCNLIQIWFQ